MPLYEYRAYDAGGKTIGGLIDAPSQNSAYGKLKKQGIFVTAISEETGGGFNVRVPSSDMIFALDQLATLLKAGIPLPEALDSLVNQVSHRDLKKAFARIKVGLEEGESFAGALAGQNIFPPVLVKMVDAGESVGAVDTILRRFTDFMERENSFREKVVGALIYPSIILSASFALIFFILSYIAPTLVKIFQSFHKDLPLSTQILIWTGTFLKNNVFVLLAVLSGVIYGYIYLLPKKYRDAFLLKIPFYGNIHRHIQVSRWARTLSMLHGGGVTLIKALSSAREVVENDPIREELKKVEDMVQKGSGLGIALSRIGVIPPLVVQMVKTGEKSGELERMLETSANFYEKEIEKNLSLFFKFLEPAIILGLGAVVGFVVVSALLPIFEINRLIK